MPNLADFADALDGSPDDYFLHESPPGTFLVVEHATGEPKYRVEGDGLAPYEKAPARPAGAAPSIAAGDGKLEMTVNVENPPPKKARGK